MYVMRQRSNNGVAHTKHDLSFDKPPPPPKKNKEGQVVSSARQHKGIRNYSVRILNNFDGSSTDRLLASINTLALARNSNSAENRIISLWSAVEVLLSEPQPGTARIVHYAKLLVPCICLRHVRRQFAAVCDEMLVSYRRRFADIVLAETQSNATDIHTRFASLMIMPQNVALRESLLKVCTDNPLALHQLWKLYSDYKSPRNATSALDSHEKRVEWQIHRIYRARNNLVHAGKVPTYLDSLIINLFEYYRGAIATIVHRARLEDHRSDVDQVVAEIGIDYGVFKRHFHSRGKEPEMKSEDAKRLIHDR